MTSDKISERLYASLYHPLRGWIFIYLVYGFFTFKP